MKSPISRGYGGISSLGKMQKLLCTGHLLSAVLEPPKGPSTGGFRVLGVFSVFRHYKAQRPKPNAQSPTPKAQSPKPKAQSPKPKAQSPKPLIHDAHLYEVNISALPTKASWSCDISERRRSESLRCTIVKCFTCTIIAWFLEGSSQLLSCLTCLSGLPQPYIHKPQSNWQTLICTKPVDR